MDTIITGLVAGSLLTLLNTYPAHSHFFAETTTAKSAQILKSPEDALTLSRFFKDGQVHTLAVLEDDGNRLTGVDISDELGRYDENSFEVIENMNFTEVVKLIRTCSKRRVVKYENLLPSVAGEEHLAIGINYAEHGKETGQVRPFMFPKFVKTDPFIHRLNYTKGWLLDYEVELGIVFPNSVCSPADLNHVMVGFLVVNDFTDRATLMCKMDSKNVTGGRGFPDAKSKKGFLPTGPYIVIPKDWRAFVKELELKLSVNDKLRQQGSAKDMVWDIDKIIERSLSVSGDKTSFFQDKMVALFDGNCIPANSIIISGTPSGVAFNAPPVSFKVRSVIKYIFTGGWLSEKMHPYVLQQYLKKEMTNPRYLKPGDQIETSINFLGSIKTSVEY